MSTEIKNRLEGIKLISFDIWSTLLHSNKEYKRLRAEALKRTMGAEELSSEEFQKITKEVDEICDNASEITGFQYGMAERVRLIFNAIPPEKRHSELKDEEIARLDDELAVLLIENMPKLIEEDLLETMAEIQRKGIKMAVVSNTGFVDGKHMRVVLEKLGVLPYTSVQIFSNEVGASKPSKLIFQALMDQTGAVASEILHIGDNEKTDVQGAETAGLKSLLFSNKLDRADSIRSIKSLVE